MGPLRPQDPGSVGRARYFLTFSTFDRRPAFQDGETAALVVKQFRRTARSAGFAILAYCLMPDEALLLIEGPTAHSDFRGFVKRAKQSSGQAYARRTKRRLWEQGCFERVLQDDTDVREVARYILWNPVRAGLAITPVEYSHLGSDVWSLDELTLA